MREFSYAQQLRRSMCCRNRLLINKFNAQGSSYELERRFTKFVEITQTQSKGHYAVQGHSRSPILVLIESIYDFLLVIDTNLPPTLHRLQVCKLWSNFRQRERSVSLYRSR